VKTYLPAARGAQQITAIREPLKAGFGSHACAGLGPEASRLPNAANSEHKQDLPGTHPGLPEDTSFLIRATRKPSWPRASSTS